MKLYDPGKTSMRTKLGVWWVWTSLWFNCLVFGSLFEFKHLGNDLDDIFGYLWAEKIANGWENRPPDFLSYISAQPLWKILKYLPDHKISEIRPEEFESSEVACKVFAEYLPKLSNIEALPNIFRQAVCNLLCEEGDLYGEPINIPEELSDTDIEIEELMLTFSNFGLSLGPHRRQSPNSSPIIGGGPQHDEIDNTAAGLVDKKIIKIIRTIPSVWMATHGSLFMKALVKFNPPSLKYLNKGALTVLLNNLDNACHSITLDALSSLDSTDLKLLSAKCVRAIDGLEKMNLSGIVENLHKFAFSEYNGPLSKGTIEKLSEDQVKYYGSLVKNEQVCNSLELYHLGPTAAIGITFRCLYGYFSSQRVNNVGLGELWKSIPIERIKSFTDDMKPSLNNIHPKDFDSMSPKLLKLILSDPMVCPTTEVSFWNKQQRIKYISSECMYKILVETETPIRLGELWEQIDSSIMNVFTDEMQLSWLQIDKSDFYYMNPKVLSIITSVPGVCSALGVSFWTREKIGHIPGECLHELFIIKRKESEGGMPLKFGELWRYVPQSSILSIAQRTKFSWNFIHPEDFDLVKDKIKCTIGTYPEICAAFDPLFWTRETVEYVTENCLYNMLAMKNEPITFGRLWESIPRLTLAGFTAHRLDLLKNVSGDDLRYMPAEFLNSIFSSHVVTNYLPQPPTGIILSSKASTVTMDAREFATLTKTAPTVAGQLLWYSEKLSEHVLSRCDGDDIRSLKLRINEESKELDWKSLFSKLKEKYLLTGRAQYFDRMVQLISCKAKKHFCTTILDLDEYLSLDWLHQNLSSSCLSALTFKPDHVHRLFNKLEPFWENISWEAMLRMHQIEDWVLLSRSKRVAAFLGASCEFWAAIDSGEWPNLFRSLDKLTLNLITLDCVLEIPRTLRENPDRVPLLADNAFSKHKVGQLPCRLQDLSPTQISHLSKGIPSGGGGGKRQLMVGSSIEITQHVLSIVTLEDIKSLGFEQFESLYKFQWDFVPEDIKSKVLTWQTERLQSQILDILVKIKNDEHGFTRNVANNNQIDDFKSVEAKLGLVLELYKGNSKCQNFDAALLGLASIMTFIRNSNFHDTFFKIFQQSPLLKTYIIGLVRNADELRDYNHKALGKMINTNMAKLPFSYNRKFGFDRSAMLELFEKAPESFATPGVRVDVQGVTDDGGPIRALVSQLLNDIGRDLVVPYTGDSVGGNKESVKGVEIEYFKDGASVMDFGDSDDEPSLEISPGTEGTNSAIGNAKFSWGIGRKAGFIVGLAFGKALQLDIRLPFSLDSTFYDLLVVNNNTKDEVIEGYYTRTYNQEVSKFKHTITNFFDAKNFEGLLDVIPRLESLRFTNLSTKVTAEEAKKDVEARTNLWGCTAQDCYEDVAELKGQNFQKEYIKAVSEAALKEFKEFICELVRGLEMSLPPVKRFKELPRPLVYPFVEFLPKLLNAEPVRWEDFLSKVKFKGSHLVKSLLQGQTIEASKVFSSFVQSLGERQLAHLIGVWTGSSTLLFKYSELSVTFMPPGSIESYQVNFCEAGEGDHLIASGEEYQAVFSKFSERLLGPGIIVRPDCQPESASIIPIRPSTCVKNLMIYLQSAEQIFNSLVDLLRTPLTTLWENR